MERRARLLHVLDLYCAQNDNLPNYQQLRNKPLYILTEAARKIFSKQEDMFIPMSVFMQRITDQESSQYNEILDDQFSAIKISDLWRYCSKNIINNEDRAYIEGLVKAAGFYLNNIILTGHDSLKAPEIEIVASLQDKLRILNRWRRGTPSIVELTQYFGIKFSDIISENSPKRFRRVFWGNEIDVLKAKLLSDLNPVSPRNYNDIISLLNNYDSETRVAEIESKYRAFQGWVDDRNRKIHGDSDTIHSAVWNKAEFRKMIRTVLFPRQGGYITIEKGEKVYHVFDGFTGEVFTWKRLTLSPHKDLQSGEIVLIATNEEGVEIAVIHHIDFNKDNNRLDNYLWILRENHKTNLNDDDRRVYIAQGKIASLAFEYGVAPRFWSQEAQLRFYESKRTNGGMFPSGDTIMIAEDPSSQLDLDHFLGNK